MNAAHVARRNPSGTVIARRAVDLALDGRVSLDDGAQHLCHLANHHQTPLHDALDALPLTPEAEPEEECARILLRRALVMLGPSSSTGHRLSA